MSRRESGVILQDPFFQIIHIPFHILLSSIRAHRDPDLDLVLLHGLPGRPIISAVNPRHIPPRRELHSDHAGIRKSEWPRHRFLPGRVLQCLLMDLLSFSGH